MRLPSELIGDRTSEQDAATLTNRTLRPRKWFGRCASAAQDCHTALVREPCRESAHRLPIQALIALRRPEQAVRQFARCRAILKEELDVEPAEETVALMSSLGSDGWPRLRRPV